MEYRILGNTGVHVSEVCLGCMSLAGRAEEADAVRIIHRALDEGRNFFDTANTYSGGRSEEILGKALEGRREDVLIATKVHGRIGEGPNDTGNCRYHVMKQVESSLKRLRSDHIDLYYFHRPDPDTALEEQVRTMDDLVRQGKVRYPGTSHFRAWMLCKSLNYSERGGLACFVADQCRYNVANRTVEVELLPFCRETGYGLVPHSPLHSGILIGKYESGKAPPPDSRGAGGSDRFQGWLTDRAYRAAEAVCAVAGDRGVSPSQVAIRWVLDNPPINAAIIGPRTMEQFEDNLGALGWTLSDEERSRLNDAAPPDAHWD